MGIDLNGNKLYSTSIGPEGEAIKRIVIDNLVFHVDAANKNSYTSGGSTWTDLSGNGNNGTIYNSPTFSSSDGGGSLSFNGSNQYMQANVGSTILDGDPNFTVEFFVKRTTDFVTTGFWGIGSSGQGNSIEGWTPTTNLIHLDLYDSTRLDSGTIYPLNTYVHVVWSKTGSAISTSTVNLYINGVNTTLTLTRNQTTGPQYPTSTAGNGIAIGRINGNVSAYYAPITMGIFRVYSKALSATEVKQNFNAQRGRFGV
jgi:hypothetical protein